MHPRQEPTGGVLVLLSEQDRLLWSLIADHDVEGIRAWAAEMRDEMPDDDAYPQQFCDRIAEEMDTLADLLESA